MEPDDHTVDLMDAVDIDFLEYLKKHRGIEVSEPEPEPSSAPPKKKKKRKKKR